MNANEYQSLERIAVHDGVRHPVVIRWSTRPGPRGHRLYGLQVDGPFGSAHGESSDLFGALQQARRSFESDGWLLAVEGARVHTHPSGMQRDMGGGLVAYQLDRREQGSYPQVGILEAADPAECGTVVDQERWYQQWLPPTPRPASVVTGRGWALLRPDLSNGRRVYRPVVGGAPVVLDGAPAVYSDRVEALAAGDQEPVSVPIDRIGSEFPRGVVIDPGKMWTWQGVPVAPRKPPRLDLLDEEPGDPIGAVAPTARVFGIGRSAARLVELPPDERLSEAVGSVSRAVGDAIIRPYVFVVADAEPAGVRRALKRRP